MGKTTLNKIQQAFDEYNKIVPEDYFLQFSKAEKGFIDDLGRRPKYVASTSTWDLQFTFNTLQELKERLNAEVQDYNISQIQ
jgi:hypothetical protein